MDNSAVSIRGITMQIFPWYLFPSRNSLFLWKLDSGLLTKQEKECIGIAGSSFYAFSSLVERVVGMLKFIHETAQKKTLS